MYFILSKLLIYFLHPFLWMVILLLAAYFIKNKKYQQRTFLTALLLLFVFSNGALLNQFTKYWDIAPDPAKTTGTYNCAIILGGYVSEDEAGNGYFNGASDRYIQAIKLKETGKVTHLLFTGGNASLNPDGFAETKWVQSQVKIFHFADSTLLFEKKSRNTIENIRNSKQILQLRQLKPPYLLVTSAFHMRRALLICKKAGLDVIPYSCDFSPGKNSISINDFIPAAETVGSWNTYLKELVGFVVTYFKR